MPSGKNKSKRIKTSNARKKPVQTEDKPRNGGRWTEGRFAAFVTSALRAASRRWPPKYERLADACVGVRKNKRTGRDAKHYRCAMCEECFPQSGVQVDHVIAIGKTQLWDEFIEKLFCEKDNLQVVCKPCHKEKTKKERAVESKEKSGDA